MAILSGHLFMTLDPKMDLAFLTRLLVSFKSILNSSATLPRPGYWWKPGRPTQNHPQSWVHKSVATRNTGNRKHKETTIWWRILSSFQIPDGMYSFVEKKISLPWSLQNLSQQRQGNPQNLTNNNPVVCIAKYKTHLASAFFCPTS